MTEVTPLVLAELDVRGFMPLKQSAVKKGDCVYVRRGIWLCPVKVKGEETYTTGTLGGLNDGYVDRPWKFEWLGDIKDNKSAVKTPERGNEFFRGPEAAEGAWQDIVIKTIVAQRIGHCQRQMAVAEKLLRELDETSVEEIKLARGCSSIHKDLLDLEAQKSIVGALKKKFLGDVEEAKKEIEGLVAFL
jgi:hypothetical protein